jgi:hypothetical protein
MKRVLPLLLLALSALPAAPAQARITQLVIERVQPFAGGKAFGNAGAYEHVSGVARGELDKTDPHNKAIVNLERARINVRGKVEYEVDFEMLRPVDATRSNNKILYEVNNRGRKFMLPWLLDAPVQAAGAANDLAAVRDTGNALFFRQGWTMVWSGWDPDAPRSNKGMAMKPVVPLDNGQPIVKTIREELVSGTRGPRTDTFHLSYDAVTFDQNQATLTVRRRESDARVEIPLLKWSYVNAHTIMLRPPGTKPEPGSLYELRYPARDPKVLGIGFAATRDLVSFLRYDLSDAEFRPNPLRGIRAVIAVGISQSGRYLRDHIAQGFNQDETGRRVFDGVLAHISGVGRLFMNTEFGEPGRTNTQHEDHLYPENEFPFSAASMKDPVSGRRGALFRGDASDPLLIEVNTSTEYWQKGASLLHTDPLARADVALPANARVYMVAGTQHGGRAGLASTPGQCANPRNPHSPAPALRALIVALDQWVSRGKAPPPSQVPTLASHTLVAPDATGFPAIPGAEVARFGNRLELFGDWKDPQVDASRAYKTLVAKVDKDGNEVAGIRLPDIAVPLGTYTGWNLYKSPFTEGELCDRDGSFLPFAKTRAERDASGDARLSLEERYTSQDDYVAKVGKAASALVRARLLLQEDADAYVAAAKKRSLY